MFKRLLAKKVLLAGIVLTLVGTSATIFTLQKPNPEPVKDREFVQSTSVVEPIQTQPEPVQEVTVSQPVVEEPQTPPVKTVTELKAQAVAWIQSTNKCGVYAENHPDCPATQAACFVEGVELAYGWDTIDEQFMLNKLQALHDKYVGMCPGLAELKKRNNNPAFF